jgi:3-dehydroquinate dehydratase/shikimate dehydrogenase
MTTIAVPIAAGSVEEMVRRVPEAESVADLIEFRLDYLEDFTPDKAVATVTDLLRCTTCPVILTCRPRKEGSEQDWISFEDRVRLWRQLFSVKHRNDLYFDLELDVVQWFEREANLVPWPQVIASYHNFNEMPSNLVEVYETLARTPAGILKIAVQADNLDECLRIFNLLDRARPAQWKFIAIGMGSAGVITRILGPLYGSFLTFGALADNERTAPGQILASELKEVYRLHDLGPRPGIMGVIGNPVAHSLSPLIHNTAFKHLGLDAVYLPMPVTDLAAFVRDFVHPRTRQLDWDLRGLSVTIPHKVAVKQFLKEIDPTAEAVGAVNTIVVEGEKLLGYNTDVEGVLRPLNERIELRGVRAMIVGAGGAARAACYGLNREGARVTVLARDLAKAQLLAEEFGCDARPLSELAILDWDVLIQATPVGMSGHSDESLIPSSVLTQGRIVFDMVYTPAETRLIKDAQAAGCQTIWGGQMLVHQAARQFELWTGQAAPVGAMMTALEVRLQCH